jgi:hypothetical protein
MKKLQTKITIRVVAAMLVTVAVVCLSTLAMHAPTQNQKGLGLKSIQTDKATVFSPPSSHRVFGLWSRSYREPARVRLRLGI